MKNTRKIFPAYMPPSSIARWGILGVIFISLPFANYFFQDLNGSSLVFLGTAICSLYLLTEVIITRANYYQCIKINHTDILFVLYLCYGIIRWSKPDDIPFDPVILCEWIGLTAIYILARNPDNKGYSYFLYLITLGGILQSLVGISQYTGLISSRNGIFPITGSFYNPGPYGGYLAISTLCAFYMWRAQKFSFRKKGLIFFLSLLLLLVALILSNSRAAWLATIIPATTFLKWKKPSHCPLWKIACLIFIILCVIGCYLYKQQSANVRLLTWASGLFMFFDNPLIGHGIGSFSTKYMLYQANFLSLYPNEEFTRIADNNLLAFNEFIHLICEQGMLGFIIFSLLLFSTLKNTRTTETIFAYNGLLCIGIFACFSYPASVFPIKIFFPLFLAILGNNKSPKYEFKTKPVLLGCFSIVLVLGLYFNLITYSKYYRAFNHLIINNNNQELFSPDTNKWHSYMLHNKSYLYMLSEQYITSKQPERALIVKKQLAHIAPTSSLLYDLGILLIHKGETASADSLFCLAHQMTPNHISPVYGSFIVARQNKDIHRSLQLAETILHMPAPVVNSIVLRARHEAKEYIKENNTPKASK